MIKILYNFLIINPMSEYGISLLLANISIYLLFISIMFAILFFFEIKYFRTLNEMRNFSTYNFLIITVFFTLLSMAGMPPLSGFAGKFLLSIYLITKNQLLVFMFFIFLNIFVLYFYLQNLRFMMTKSSSIFLNVKQFNVVISYSLLCVLVVFNFLNVFGILIIEDFILQFVVWFIHIYV